MTITLKLEKNVTAPQLSVIDPNSGSNLKKSEKISYLGMYKVMFPEVRDQLTRGQLQEKVEMLVADFIEDNSDLNLVMEIAVTYEMLGKMSFAYYYYFWAYEVSEKDETLAIKLGFLRKKLSEKKN